MQAVTGVIVDMNGVNILWIVVPLLILIISLALGGRGRVVVVAMVDCSHGEESCLSLSGGLRCIYRGRGGVESEPSDVNRGRRDEGQEEERKGDIYSKSTDDYASGH